MLVGHSERREYYGEDDKLVNAKARKAVDEGLTPIVCVGEGIEVREELDQVAFTIAHVEEALGGLTLEQIGSLVVAYEQFWAIGTGKVATPEDAQEVCEHHAGMDRYVVRSIHRTSGILYGRCAARHPM